MADFVRGAAGAEYIGLSTDTKPTTSEDTTATLAEALDDSETGVDVSDGTLISTGRTILIDSEEMNVLSISVNTLTVQRAVNGTVAATHLIATAIYYRRDVPVNSRAFETDTGNWYTTKDGINWVLDKRVL